MAGFALTNSLAASAGCLTAQTVGYADIGMGFGMTLTGIGAIILGQQIFRRLKRAHRHCHRRRLATSDGGAMVARAVGETVGTDGELAALLAAQQNDQTRFASSAALPV